MKLRFLCIPVQGGEAAETEVNTFLAAHRVVAVERELIQDGSATCWAICVTYLDGEAQAGQEKRSYASQIVSGFVVPADSV